MSKFTHVEYFSKSKNCLREIPILDCFCLAIITDQFVKEDCPNLCGLNMCVVYDTAEAKNHGFLREDPAYWVEGKICFHLKDFVTVYLVGDGVRIPIEIHDINRDNISPYDNKTEMDYGYPVKTECLFGYIHPFIFDCKK